MAEFLGLGMTHYPMLAGTDEHMADLLRWTMADPDIPTNAKNPNTWPVTMMQDWVDDVAAAAQHRADLLTNLDRVRAALDDFRPDLVVVWGDDQYENFREEVVPPFCVLAYGDLDVPAFEVMNERGSPNAWGLPDDQEIVLRGDAGAARALAEALGEEGVDMAYSYRKRAGAHFPHAILNTQLFLDYPNAGRKFPYPLVPITVNCYGPHAIARKGGLARFADIAAEQLDPSGPPPSRCLDLGAAVVRAYRDTDLRIALVASSSWSHAFLCDRTWHLRPDTEADRLLYDAMVSGDIDTWRQTTAAEIVGAGQHEILNWFCLLGATAEAGLNLIWSDMVETDVFNSNKCFAVYEQAAK